MSEFLIDECGVKIWYDLKSHKLDYKNRITRYVNYPNQPIFYVRKHNEDGPAVIDFQGVYYCIKGKYHREDGPAVIFFNGQIQWYLNDLNFSFDDWCKQLDKTLEEITYLKLKWSII